MPRKLKTYITNLGFFELALAAPSMKAALEAWGMGHNAFHHGFARETDDPKIVAAAMAKPGTVLRRPVGTKGAFTENADLPKQLWKIEPSSSRPAKPKPHAQPKPKQTRKRAGRKTEKTDRAAIISFEKAKNRRERQREQEEARAAAREDREHAQRQRAVDKAEAALARAQERYDDAMATIEREREKLDRRAEIETDKWESERGKLRDLLRQAKD
jgi:colicin import membrane protein